MLPARGKTNIAYDVNHGGSLEYVSLENLYSINYHLYITSDDEIKEGDWFYNTFNDHQPKIQQRKGNWRTCFNQHKIIATTDKFLTKEIIELEGIGGRIARHELFPQPSKAFIEKYCKRGGIDEAIVEYKEDNNPSLWGQDIGVATLIPKTNSRNEITIHPIKNSWTREEVESLLKSAWGNGYNNGQAGASTSRSLDWIKDNL